MKAEDVAGEGDLREAAVVRQLSASLDADIFLFSGPLNRQSAYSFADRIEQAGAGGHSNVALILATYGGDADGAFIVARMLKARYEKLLLYVFGFCKSAGTLVALGADEIIMSARGELGPLDVQLRKEDEFTQFGSGLDISKALDSLNGQAFSFFEKHFLEIKRRSGGFITTRTAADIATCLAVGLISPIAAQIDPLKLGEIHRAMDVAYRYGVLLGAEPATVEHLMRQYPSHTFVIDREEAANWFPRVRRPSALELRLETWLREETIVQTGRDCVRMPHPEGVLVQIEPQQQEEPSDDSQSVDCKHEGRPGNEGGQGGDEGPQSEHQEPQERASGLATNNDAEVT